MQIGKKAAIKLRLVNNKNYKFDYLVIFINLLIKRGLKQKARGIVYDFVCYLKKYFLKFNIRNFFDVFQKTFDFYKPKLKIISKKIAAKVYLIPWYINENKSKVQIVKWFIECSKKRTEKNLSLRLYSEFIDFYNGQGLTIKKLEEYYKIARDNRAFVKFLKKRKRVFRSRLKKYSI